MVVPVHIIYSGMQGVLSGVRIYTVPTPWKGR